jgi:ParB family chromosome partitioning protein
VKKKKKIKEFSEEDIKFEALEDKVIPITLIPINDLIELESNINEQDDKTFSALTASIQSEGMYRQPLLVSSTDDGKYEVIAGNHRLQAIRLLGWEKAPCIVDDIKNPLLKRATSAKLNMIHGEPNSAKFTQLYNDLAKDYGDEQAKELVGVTNDKLFKQLYLDIQKNLPTKQMKKEFKERANEVENIDEIQSILNEMLSKYGNTISENYMVFTFGGKTHLWLKLDESLKVKINKIVEKASAFEIDLTQYFNKLCNYRNSIFKKYYNVSTDDIENAFIADEDGDQIGSEPVYNKPERVGKYKKKKKSEGGENNSLET